MDRLKVYLKYIVKLVVRMLSRVLFIFPLRQNQIMFSVFLGEKVTCNPKCVYDYLRENCQDKIKFVWAYNGTKESSGLENDVVIAKEFSLKWFYYRVTSQIIVDNCNPTYSVPRRKGQFVLQTWHAGGAYKKVGIAASQYKIEQDTMAKAMEVTDLFVSSSQGFTNGNIISGYHYSGEVLNCGMPKNDIFFDPQRIESAANKVKNHYGIKGRVVLYAPTFRGNLHHAEMIDDVLDISELYERVRDRYDDDVTILVRCHHWDKHKYKFEGNAIDVADYPEMQELLCASDILITDYSSSMWDYALLGRPCLLYVPDVDDYISNRGFFTPIEQWPGIVCKDMHELCEAVEKFSENECVEIARRHLKTMGSYETGHATEIVCGKILEHTEFSDQDRNCVMRFCICQERR